MSETLAKSRNSAGVLAVCLADWTGAETVEARVAAFRAAELMNLIQSFLTKK